MKRAVLGLVILIVVAVASCSTTPPPAPPEFAVTVASEKSSGVVGIQVEVDWQTVTFLTPRILGEPKPVSGIRGFLVGFTNNTDTVLRVVWEESSLAYNGQSFVPFVEGQKYSESSRPMTPMLIPAGTTIMTGMHSSQQPYYVSGQHGGWRMANITAQELAIILCIQSGETKDTYTVHIGLQR